jgi:hypothetical protein
VLELLGLALEKVVALFKRRHASSLNFTLPGYAHSAKHRVDLGEGEWHFRALIRDTWTTILCCPETRAASTIAVGSSFRALNAHM